MLDHKHADLFWADNIDKQWKIEYDGGVIKNEDLFSQSVEITESLCSESELRFGCCEAGSLKFKIANVIQSLIGEWLTVSIVLNHDQNNPFLVGRYKVASDKATSDRRHREVVAYDAMYEILNTSMINWYNKILPNNSSWTTMFQFRSSFAAYFGISQNDVTLVNDGMQVQKTIQVSEGEDVDNEEEQVSVLKESSLSGKDVLSAICEVNGCFPKIGRDGKLHYIYLEQSIEGLYPANTLFPDHAPDYMVQSKTGHLYPQSPKSYGIDRSNYIECKWEDYTVREITKLQVRQEENDIGCVIGTGDNCYIIEGNFLLYGKTKGHLKIVAENIFQKIKNIAYRPFDADCVGNPCLEIGDPIRISTRYEIVESYIIKRTMKGIQALRDSYSAAGPEKYSKKANSVSKSIIQLKGKTNALIRNVEETRLEMRDMGEGLSNTITVTAEETRREIKNTKEGLETIISETAEGINETIKNTKEGLETKISKTVKGIEMSVSNNKTGKTAEVKLLITEEGGTRYEVTADKIDFSGLVSFTNLETGGQTNINGDNITTGTINSINIHNGNITDGKYPFSVDSNGNMFANNATIWGNLYGLNNLKLYNDIRGTHRTFVRLTNGDFPDSAQFEFLKPVSGRFLVVNEQEGAYFTDKISFQKNIVTNGNIEISVAEDGTRSIETYGPDGKMHGILAINKGKEPWTTGVGMDDAANTKTIIRGRIISSQTGITITSDERMKNSFKTLDEFEGVYMDIEPCAFKYNNGTSGRYHFGVKAGNVKESFEKHGYTTQDFGGFVQMADSPENEDYCGVDDPMGIIYTEFIAWNTCMIQRLYKKMDEQHEKIDYLEKKLCEIMGGG